MQAPVGTLAGLFAAPLRNLGYALAQVADQKRQADGMTVHHSDPTTQRQGDIPWQS